MERGLKEGYYKKELCLKGADRRLGEQIVHPIAMVKARIEMCSDFNVNLKIKKVDNKAHSG